MIIWKLEEQGNQVLKSLLSSEQTDGEMACRNYRSLQKEPRVNKVQRVHGQNDHRSVEDIWGNLLT